MACMLKLREAPPLRTVNNPLYGCNRTSCYHLGSLEADLTQIPTPETPCNRYLMLLVCEQAYASALSMNKSQCGSQLK
ncbi:hypothetical protein K1719_004941 [Acacia pycnantha]|nr:hypothetical protein K1719_004941 [Acacia pycnantha]